MCVCKYIYVYMYACVYIVTCWPGVAMDVKARAVGTFVATVGRIRDLPKKKRVQGSGFRVQGSGFRVHGLGFRV